MNTPLARTDLAARRLQWFLDRTLERLARVAPRALAVDLVGSLARGEGSVLFRGQRALVLSDLDLAVIFPDARARDRAAPRLAQASLELAEEFTRWDFLAAIDLGAYAVRDLSLQAPRPGTLEWARSGVTVAGDPACRARLPLPLESAIPLEEALSLLENRMLELLWVYPLAGRGEPRAWAALYAGGKAVLDAALARLLHNGQCPVGSEARAEAYAALPDAGSATPSIESVHRWTKFKLRPGAECIAAHDGAADVRTLGGDVTEWAHAAWQEGGAALLAVYEELLGQSGRADGTAWLQRAAGRARWRRRLRRGFDAWRESGRRRLGWGRLDNLGRFAQSGTPEHVLGATAAALVAEDLSTSATSEVSPPVAPVIPGLVAAVDEAPWETRRRQAVEAWDRWILRGTRVGRATS